MIKKVSRIRRLFVLEPYLWLQRCFFQPVEFKRAFETVRLPQRLIMMLRLTPLLFLLAYTPALIVRIVIYLLRPDLFPYYAIHKFAPLSPGIGWFLFDATWATALSCLIGAIFAGLFSLRLGIAGALALGLANGIIVNTANDTFVGITFGIAFGLALGIAFNSAHALKEGGLEDVTIASALGILGGLVIGFLTGTIGGYWAGYALGILDPSLQDNFLVGGSFVGLAVGGMSGCLLAALFGEIAKRKIKGKDQAVSTGVKVGIAVAGAFGLALGIPVGDSGFYYDTFTNGILAGVREGLIFGIGFLFFYLVSYYRLPLYPISAYSAFRAHLASRRQPQRTLYCLRHSSLHWDECVFLPLPYLKSMLLLASKEDLDETLEEINFIVRERIQQRLAAQAAAYELALRELERRTILRDIGQAHEQLAMLLPHQMRSMSSNAETVFRFLDDASREAASYIAQINKQARHEALERMIGSLQATRQYKAFPSAELNHHLNTVISQWSMLAEQGKETLQSISGRLYIENPYVPGHPLERGDSLFVGRDDIIQKLGQALQQKYHPTFLLYGERRMGKSSILKQLPVLLGPHYIPVFYDLQAPGMIASTAAFFATIAAGIKKQLSDRGLPVQQLDRSQFEQAQQMDEIEVYALFDQWYTAIDQALDQINCVLILMFDEFEKLEDAEERGSINLNLLFNWLRSVMQNHPHMALLFSGAKLVGDMGRSWAGYFVSVEHIKISFLRAADTHNLIVQPIPHIFNDEVAEEIMRVTHNHPFLVQAICKSTIEILNDDSREQATVEDVLTSVGAVFETWAGYFWDLWNRCDPDQQTSLLALPAFRAAEVDQIVERSELGEQEVFLALEKLQMRDLVVRDGSVYQLAIPLFARWVEQNRHLLLSSHES
jgi:AAA ATPase domain